MTFTYQPPFHQLEQAERQVNQVFDPLEQQAILMNTVHNLANIQMDKTSATVKLTAVLPNIDPTELKVEIIDKSVLISGRIDENPTSEIVAKSQAFAPFRWVVALPTAVTSAPVDLDYNNGILTLLLQKIDAI